MSKGDVGSLPKWAQEYIKNIERERETAIRALREYLDGQTESPIFVEEMESLGEQRGPSRFKRYIQGYKVNFIHAGVELEVNVYRDGEIYLQWHSDGRGLRDTAFIPTSYSSAVIKSKENMR